MEMALYQPDNDAMVILTPMDREAKAWWHFNVQAGWNDGATPPYILEAQQADIILSKFLDEGGKLTMH